MQRGDAHNKTESIFRRYEFKRKWLMVPMVTGLLAIGLLVLSACGDDSWRSTTDGPEADPSPREPEVPAPSVPEDCLSIRGMRYCGILVFLEGDDGPTS